MTRTYTCYAVRREGYELGRHDVAPLVFDTQERAEGCRTVYEILNKRTTVAKCQVVEETNDD